MTTFRRVPWITAILLTAMCASTAAQLRDTMERMAPLRVMLVPSDGGTEDGTREDWQPLFDSLARHTGYAFEIRVGQSYSTVVEAIASGRIDLAYMGTVSFLTARGRGPVEVLAIGEMDGGAYYYSGLFTRLDSPVRTIADLRGRSLALTDPSSSSGFVYPLNILLKEGIDPVRDLSQILITGSHGNSLSALREGHVDVAAAPFESYIKAVQQGVVDPRRIRILAKSDPIPNPPLAVAAALSPGLLLPPAHAMGEVVLKMNPYAAVDWERTGHYKANLHTHTTQSDGRMPPAEVIGHYQQRGYHILAITDHDRCTWPWQKFGADPARLGMVAVAGNELSRHHHTLSLFCTLATQTRNLEAAIAEVAEAGGVAVLAHPAMHWPREQRRVPGLQVELTAALRSIAQADFTVEAWFRTTDAGRNILMGNYAGGRGGALNLELHTDNRIRIYLAPVEGDRTVDLNVAAATLDVDTRDGQWHHLAAVRHGQTVRLYLDGRPAGAAPDTAGAFDLLGDLYHLGRDTRTGSTTFTGDLDHVRLWQRALSGEELAAVFRGDVPGKPGGPSTKDLLVQYTFEHPDDTPAEAGAAVVGPVADSAGNAAGPFPAIVTPQGAPVAATDVPAALKRSGASQMALRFATSQDDEAGVPAHVAERYAELFGAHENLIGMEVLNGTRPLSEYALDRELWDKLLARLMPARPVWGFSTDDMHSMAHLGRDWIVVLAPALDEAAVRGAICRGAFFSATIRLHDAASQSVGGTPAVTRIDHDAEAGTLTIQATHGEEPLPDDGYLWIADGQVVHTGPVLNYRATPGIGSYVRAELTGSGGTVLTNPFGFQR